MAGDGPRPLPVPKSVGDYRYIVIDQLDLVTSAVNEIKSKVVPGGYCPTLAVDLEGVNLGRRGTITVITVATRDVVYLFDLLNLGPSAFDSGLKSLLEDPDAEKLMFDCRHDADALWHLYGVYLDGVLDLQLMDVLLRRNLLHSPAFPVHSRKLHMIHKGVERLNGYGSCAAYHVAELKREMAAFKDVGKDLLLRRQDLWNIRPLTEEMLSYCCVDTSPMFRLFDALSGKMLSKYRGPEYVKRARVASRQYADNMRKMTTYTGSVFEEHNYLPFDMDVFLEFEEMPPTVADGGDQAIVCPNCNRIFSAHYYLSVHKSCFVCLKVMQDRAKPQAS